MRKKKKLAELGQENDENEDLSTKLEQKKLLHSPLFKSNKMKEKELDQDDKELV